MFWKNLQYQRIEKKKTGLFPDISYHLMDVIM